MGSVLDSADDPNATEAGTIGDSPSRAEPELDPAYLLATMLQPIRTRNTITGSR